MFEDSWEVKINTIHNCDKAPKEIIVWIEPLAKMKIDALMTKYKSIEWLAYLVGGKEENVVTDIFIPNQDVSAVNVWNIMCPEYNELDIIGVIHSHHGMGNGFSGTDHEWINQNHNISLCISKGGVAGQVRWKTPCGSLKIVKATTKLKFDIDFNTEEFIEDVESKIKEFVPQVKDYYNGKNYYKAINEKWNEVKEPVWVDDEEESLLEELKKVVEE